MLSSVRSSPLPILPSYPHLQLPFDCAQTVSAVQIQHTLECCTNPNESTEERPSELNDINSNHEILNHSSLLINSTCGGLTTPNYLSRSISTFFHQSLNDTVPIIAAENKRPTEEMQRLLDQHPVSSHTEFSQEMDSSNVNLHQEAHIRNNNQQFCHLQPELPFASICSLTSNSCRSLNSHHSQSVAFSSERKDEEKHFTTQTQLFLSELCQSSSEPTYYYESIINQPLQREDYVSSITSTARSSSEGSGPDQSTLNSSLHSTPVLRHKTLFANTYNNKGINTPKHCFQDLPVLTSDSIMSPMFLSFKNEIHSNRSSNAEEIISSFPQIRKSEKRKIWNCSYGCGISYRKSSGRSIRKHVMSCFRDHCPNVSNLSEREISSLIGSAQERGTLDTGLRRWKMRRKRRYGKDLHDEEKWICPWSCGQFYLSSSSRSIQKHALVCVRRLDLQNEVTITHNSVENASKTNSSAIKSRKEEMISPGNDTEFSSNTDLNSRINNPPFIGNIHNDTQTLDTSELSTNSIFGSNFFVINKNRIKQQNDYSSGQGNHTNVLNSSNKSTEDQYLGAQRSNLSQFIKASITSPERDLQKSFWRCPLCEALINITSRRAIAKHRNTCN